jgi:hypothetical protein
MRRWVWLFLFAVPSFEADSSWLIVKHASTSSQAFVSGANWRYVAGDFPKEMKWKSNITDRNIRKIKELGGRVVIVPTDYHVADVEDARKQCGTAPEKSSTAETTTPPNK